MKRLLLLCLFLSSLFSQAQEKEPIVIASKTFSESVILGEMVALLIEEKFNHPVERKTNLGGTKFVFDALNNNQIHVYPDYTGTGYVMILKLDGERDPNRVHQIVSREFEKKFGIQWSKPLGFNNTYALTVRESDENFKNIHSISQLSHQVQPYKYAAPHEFMERKDGHKRFSQKYQLNFKSENIISMEAGLMYSAIRDKQVDFIVSYSTDGRIKAYSLKTLKDDVNFFPPYHVALLAKKEALKKFPALKKSIDLMEGLISEAEMIDMNDKVDRLKQEPKAIAKNFLIQKGLLKGHLSKQQKETNLFNYFLLKKDYVLKLLGQHLLLSLGALFLALIIALPLGVLLTRYQSLGKVVFPIINTIQTIPSLALLGFLIPLMGIGFPPALLALFLYSLLPLVSNTYSGILGIDQSYIEASRGMGLTNFQILTKVEIPLALPIIITGFRTAAVIVIGTTTLAALIGAGGLGDPIFRGISTVNSNLILLGAIPTALLAIAVDKLIESLQFILVSKGIRITTQAKNS